MKKSPSGEVNIFELSDVLGRDVLDKEFVKVLVGLADPRADPEDLNKEILDHFSNMGEGEGTAEDAARILDYIKLLPVWLGMTLLSELCLRCPSINMQFDSSKLPEAWEYAAAVRKLSDDLIDAELASKYNLTETGESI